MAHDIAAGNGKIRFELVSPEARVMDEPATMVVIPGGDGDLGVLAEHSPVVTTIRPGVISIYKNDMQTITDQIFLDGGFADITAERCTVLAELATPLSKINRADVEKDIATLKSDMALAASETEKNRYQKKIDIAQAKLEAVTNAA